MTDKTLPQRRHFLQSTAAAAFLAAIGERALAADPALESLKIINGFPAGSTTDTTARRVADRLGLDGFARSAVVENRTGAGGQLAVQALKGQVADGRTLLVTPMSMLGIYPHTYRKLPYDPIADLQPVSLAASFDFGLGVGPAVPASVRTLADYLQWVKGDKTRNSFGGPAAGAQPHFVGVMLGRAAGVEMNHVAYRGTAPALQDVLGGQIPAAIGPIGDVMRFAGQPGYRVLATTGTARSRFAPDVPTLAEAGFKDLVFDEWFGVFMPRGASPALLQSLNAALRKAVEHPDTVKGYAQMGMEARACSPAELSALLQRDTTRWGPIVKAVGFTADS